MNIDLLLYLTNVPPNELRAIVCLVLGTEAEPVGPVSATRIGRSAGTSTVGIYRVTGAAQTHAGEQPWSAVVKVIGVPEITLHNADVDAHRELAVYQDGVFASQQGSVRSAVCYAIQERNGQQLIWLEDLSTAPQPPWTPEYYIRTARHIGHFNGYWPEEALPNWPWLNRGGLYHKYHAPLYAETFNQLPALQSHPLVRLALPPDVLQDLLQLWSDSHALFRQIGQTAQGMCHLDCHPKNLFPMRDAAGGSYTIAIDWAWVGIDCLGADVGLLLASPIKWFELSTNDAEALVEPVFDAYITGLAEAGWSGDEDRIRLTYLTCLGTGEAIRITEVLSHAVAHPETHPTIERLLGMPVEQSFARLEEVQRFHLDYHQEALRLARKMQTHG